MLVDLEVILFESFDSVSQVSMLILQALEKFLYEASSLLAKLEEIQDGLSREDFADTLEGLKDQIKHNQHVKKWIVKAPVEILQDEGEKLRTTLQDPDQVTDGFTAEDVKKAELQIHELVEELHSKRQKLRELWNLRKLKLDQCFQYRVFQQDAEKVRKNYLEFLTLFDGLRVVRWAQWVNFVFSFLLLVTNSFDIMATWKRTMYM